MQFEAGEFTAGSKTPLCFSIMTDTDTPSPYVFAGKDGGQEQASPLQVGWCQKMLSLNVRWKYKDCAHKRVYTPVCEQS